MFMGVFVGCRIILVFLISSLHFSVLSKFSIVDIKHFHVEKMPINKVKGK